MPYVLAVGNDQDTVPLNQAFNQIPAGIRVTCVKNGSSVWDFITGRPPSEFPLLMIIDQYLPDIDTLALLMRIKTNEQSKLIPVAILSANVSLEEVNVYYRAGANCIYKKPMDSSDWSHMAECLLTLFDDRFR